MKTKINRDYASHLDEAYAEILSRENHHDHQLIIDEHDVLRWEENPDVRRLIDEKIDLNHLLALFQVLGYDKNSELYRKLYRDIGYSLSGYYDIFYWDANNPECDYYQPIIK